MNTEGDPLITGKERRIPRDLFKGKNYRQVCTEGEENIRLSETAVQRGDAIVNQRTRIGLFQKKRLNFIVKHNSAS